MNSMSEEAQKEIHDQCFVRWVADIDTEAKSSDITGNLIILNSLLIKKKKDCLKIFNELMETYSELPNNNN